jgi:hypothetical protein
MTGDRMKMLMLTLPFMVRYLIEPEVHVHVYTFYIPVVNMYTLSITQSLVHACTNCLTLLTPVKRSQRYPFSAWNGILRLASRAFQGLSYLDCTKKLLIFLTSCRKISLIRQGKKPSGILKRHTAFCTNSAKLCCGETQITLHVKLLRYVHVYKMYIHIKNIHMHTIYMYIIINTVDVCICMLCTCFIHVYTYTDCYLT